MKKLIFLFLSIASLGAFAQTEPIAPEYVRTDSIASFTNNEDIKLVGRGTGGVNIEGQYTLPKTDGTANQVFKTDGAGNIVFDNVSFSEIEGTDTVLTISDTVSTLATQYDLTQIQGYTVANSANNRVITSVDSENGNAETNLTFDGTNLNLVTGGLRIGGTEVISSGRAFSGTTLGLTGNITATGTFHQLGSVSANTMLELVGSPTNSEVKGTVRFRSDVVNRYSQIQGYRGSVSNEMGLYLKTYNAGEVTALDISPNGDVDFTGSLTAGATTVSSFTNSGVAGTGERLKTATSTGLENTISNGTDGQVMTIVSGSPAWDDPTGDVTGPASSTDNAVALFNGTTGKIIQNSSLVLNDATLSFEGFGSLIGAGTLTTTPSETLSSQQWQLSLFDEAATSPEVPPRLYLRFNDSGTEKIAQIGVRDIGTHLFNNYSGATTNTRILPMTAYWGSGGDDDVAEIVLSGGTDGTNRDDGYIVFKTQSDNASGLQEVIRINQSGDLLMTNDLASTGARISTGYFTNITSTNAVNVDSDIRLKKNVNTIKSGLDVVGQIKPVSYKWKDKEKGTGRHYGVIAQEIKEVLPEIVNDTGDNLTVSYTELIPFLIRAIQEQQEQIEDLKNQINK